MKNEENKNKLFKKRNNRWKNKISITEESKVYIKSIQDIKKYRTMAGTLDFIINDYKKNKKKYDKRTINESIKRTLETERL